MDLLRGDPMLDAAAIAARIGATKAAVSVHLSNLTKKGVILGRGYVVRREAQSVVVVGGANMDLRAHSSSPVRSCARPTQGSALTTPGGVGRNIAENLARLGSPTQLIAPVGRDAFGDQLVSATRSAGVDVDHLIVSDEAHRHLSRRHGLDRRAGRGRLEHDRHRPAHRAPPRAVARASRPRGPGRHRRQHPARAGGRGCWTLPPLTACASSSTRSASPRRVPWLADALPAATADRADAQPRRAAVDGR